MKNNKPDPIAAALALLTGRPAAEANKLVEQPGFGPNPGGLKMWRYAPRRPAHRAALVVILHGCGQSAAEYAFGAGWMALAERYGFYLLCPEQTGANNPNRCFNWFAPEDQRPGAGEPASIRAMIQWMVDHMPVRKDRIFVTGLSAGGGMANVMLASYPDVFAGGGIVAGLAYGVADSMASAFGVMMQGPPQDARPLGDLVRRASGHKGRWPRISIWQGTADRTVAPVNADKIAQQWINVHRANNRRRIKTAGREHTVWHVAGEPVVELYSLQGMGHGAPLASGAAGWGTPGPFLIEAGISSSLEMLRFWHVVQGVADVSAIIARALKAAGLVKKS